MFFTSIINNDVLFVSTKKLSLTKCLVLLFSCLILKKYITKFKLHRLHSSSTEGHKILARLLPDFVKLNVFGFDFTRLEALRLTLKENLNCNNDVHHHNFSSKSANAKFFNDNEIKHPPCKHRVEGLNRASYHKVIC